MQDILTPTGLDTRIHGCPGQGGGIFENQMSCQLQDWKNPSRDDTVNQLVISFLAATDGRFQLRDT